MAEDTIYKIELRRDLVLAKNKTRRFGGTVGCGLGVAWVPVTNPVTNQLSTEFAPGGLCGVLWGVRF